MPQIWPMNWILLFVYFLSIFILFITLVYFIKSPSVEILNPTTSHSNTLDWKW